LEAFEPEPLPVHMVYAPRNPVPLKLRAFINWVTPRLRARLAFPDDTRNRTFKEPSKTGRLV
jgi:hypothetical protein